MEHCSWMKSEIFRSLSNPNFFASCRKVKFILSASEAPRKVNVRVIAATHKDLEKLVREKLFREDLYYRIATLTVKVPRLRERPEDISALISHYLSHYARRNDKAIAGITWQAIRVLEEYSWPGNVRELAGEMERLVLYAEEGGYITPDHLSDQIQPANPKKDGESLRRKSRSVIGRLRKASHY